MSEPPTHFEAATAPPAPRLAMRHIAKSFGGVRALRDVSFTAGAGEVHAICAENGAGKSTLMKILAGDITDFEGEILLDGRPVRFAGPREAEDAGIRHKMNEVFTLADRVTVLRDGQFVATAPRDEASPEQVVRWMVGREINSLNYVKHPVGERAILELERVSLPSTLGSGRPSLREISFTVRAGDIV
jgi:ABC-type sugar transport system ATPase subunit